MTRRLVTAAGILLAATPVVALRVKPSPDATGVSSEPSEYFRSADRYRDLAIGPDGRRLFLVTDSFGTTQDAGGQRTDILAHPGALLEFSYVSAERKDPQP